MKRILITIPVSDSHRERLNKAAAGCSIQYTPACDVTEEQVQEANFIIGNVPASMIAASKNLEVLQLEWAGADAYLKPGILDKSTLLCNATGAYSRSVAEHAIALTFMLMKKLYLYRDAQNDRTWIDYGTVTSPVGATVLVVGLGDIGKRYAEIMQAMGAYVIGVKRRPGEIPACVQELVLTDSLDEVLPRADIVFSILPNTKATAGLFTAERFAMMKNSALFVNCGRGNVVSSDVLMQALNKEEIAAAAIDVFEQEPLPKESPLWKQKNLVLTPHVAGSFHLPYTLECIVDIACENLTHWQKGEECRNIIDFETGYVR